MNKLSSLELLKKEGYVITLQKKEFVLYAGLLWLAKTKGLESIKTELIHTDPQKTWFFFKAIAEGKEGTYEGHGDAAPFNVGKLVKPSVFRMAETRAKARALRDYCGVGMCSFEELS
tara:strand:- start:746 stop:1096 length:351 start_codon:yes stop_codon:yes gene_type:complete